MARLTIVGLGLLVFLAGCASGSSADVSAKELDQSQAQAQQAASAWSPEMVEKFKETKMKENQGDPSGGPAADATAPQPPAGSGIPSPSKPVSNK